MAPSKAGLSEGRPGPCCPQPVWPERPFLAAALPATLPRPRALSARSLCQVFCHLPAQSPFRPSSASPGSHSAFPELPRGRSVPSSQGARLSPQASRLAPPSPEGHPRGSHPRPEGPQDKLVAFRILHLLLRLHGVAGCRSGGAWRGSPGSWRSGARCAVAAAPLLLRVAAPGALRAAGGGVSVHTAARRGCGIAFAVTSSATARSHLRAHTGQDGRHDPNFCGEQVGGKRTERYSIGCLGK